MARIRFYPEDNQLHPSDHIVGTDEVSGGGATRVFTVQALTDYLFDTLGLDEIIEQPVEPNVPEGVTEVSDTIVQNRILCPADVSITEVVGESLEALYIYRNTLGATLMEFEIVGNSGIDLSSLEGVDFRSIPLDPVETQTETYTGTISSFDGVVRAVGTPGATTYYYRFTLTGTDFEAPVSIPPAPDDDTNFRGLRPETLILLQDVYKYVTGIGGDTMVGGDLTIGGDIISGGEVVDLVAIQSRLTTAEGDISTNTNDLTNKANTVDLHPAASIPVPNPTTVGTATTAITGINIDPNTQQITVTRGTVPVIIGDVSTGGGADISFNSVALDEINIPATSTGNVTFSLSGSDLVADVDLSQVEVYNFDDGTNGNVVFTLDGTNLSGSVDLDDYYTQTEVDALITPHLELGTTSTTAAAGDHNHSFTNLEDVSILTGGLTGGELVAWDSVNSRWIAEPSTEVTGVENITDLLDVTITTPANNQFLRYDGSGWVNETVESILTYDSSDEERRVNDSLQGTNPGAQIPVAQPDTYGLVKLDASAIRVIESCDNPTTTHTLSANGSSIGAAVELTSIGSFDRITSDGSTVTFTLGGTTVLTGGGNTLINLVLNSAANPDFGIIDTNVVDLSAGAQDIEEGSGFYRYITESIDPFTFSGSISFPTPVPAGSYSLQVALGTQTVSEVCIDADVEITGGLTINGNPVSTSADAIIFADATGDVENRTLPVDFDSTTTPGTVTAVVDASSLEFDIMHGTALPDPASSVAEELFILDSEDSDGRAAGLYRFNGTSWVVVATHGGGVGGGINYFEQPTSGSLDIPVDNLLEDNNGNIYVNTSGGVFTVASATTDFSSLTLISPQELPDEFELTASGFLGLGGSQPGANAPAQGDITNINIVGGAGLAGDLTGNTLGLSLNDEALVFWRDTGLAQGETDLPTSSYPVTFLEATSTGHMGAARVDLTSLEASRTFTAKGSQTVAATTWTIAHSLNTNHGVVNPVLVQIYDTTGVQIIPEEITLTDNNTVTVTFASTNVAGSWIVTG